MKRWLIVFGCLCIFYKISAQASLQIKKMEYFIDHDSGAGKGTPITITTADTIRINNLSVPVTFILPGTHALYVRVKNDSGWSATESFPFYVASVTGGAQLTAAEYFIDADPGTGQANKITIANPADTIKLALQLPTTGISPGMHSLNVRFMEATGNYSLYESFPFFVTTEIVNMPKIIAAEYFFGIQDPGVGNATPLNVSPGGDTVIKSFAVSPIKCNVNIDTALALYIRVKDADGRWSLFAADTFKIRGPNTVTTIKTGVWSDPTIWSNNKVPDANTSIILYHDITVDIDATCLYLYTFCNKVTINTGKGVTITGHL